MDSENQTHVVDPERNQTNPQYHTDSEMESIAKETRPSTSERPATMEKTEQTETVLERAKTKEEIEKEEEEIDYLPMGPKLYLIILSLMLTVFCVALDNTIIAVAIPRITDEFHNLNDVGWYASAYLLTSCSFQLLFGKIYSLFSVKWIFLVALFIFEVGSLVCGVAPSSTALIVGRAVAGLGSSGIFSGALITIARTVPLEKRPILFGLIGGMYGISSVAGPLVSFCSLLKSLVNSNRWAVLLPID
jgi:hypothetical protein